LVEETPDFGSRSSAALPNNWRSPNNSRKNLPKAAPVVASNVNYWAKPRETESRAHFLVLFLGHIIRQKTRSHFGASGFFSGSTVASSNIVRSSGVSIAGVS
jgi:hypothetical protein